MPKNIIDFIHDRNDQFKNVNILTAGLTGSGKSYGDICILMDLENDYEESILKRVHFDDQKFISALRRPPKGKQFETELLDDAGFNLSARTWWKDEQIKFIQDLQVARVDRKNSIVSVPHPKLADGGISTITHFLIVLDYWANTKTGIGSIRKHIITATDNGVKEKWLSMGRIEFEHVPRDVADAYEERKAKELRETRTHDEGGIKQMIVDHIEALKKKDGKTISEACALLEIEERTFYRYRKACKKA